MSYSPSLPLDGNNKFAPFYTPKNITGQATTLVKTGAGFAKSIVFGKPVATATVVVYDGIDAGGTVLSSITIPASPQPFTLPLDWYFGTGLTVVTGVANQDLTVTFY